MKNRLLILPVIWALTSCNTVNTTNVNHTVVNETTVISSEQKTNEKQELQQASLPNTKKDQKKDLCSNFVFPVPPPLPDMRLKDFEAIKPHDYEAMDALELKIIREHRLYAERLRTEMIKTRNAILAGCRPSTSK